MKKLLRWLPAVLWMGVIFVFSSIPSKEMPSFGLWDFLVKKGGHMLGYGILALCFWYALKWERKHFWVAFGLTVLYGLSDEIHQLFVTGRHFSLYDSFGFDAVGGLILLTLVRIIWQKKK
jgi:VanZ family protein